MFEKNIHPLIRFPFFDEDPFAIDFSSQSGLSVSEDKNHVYVEANMPGLNSEDIEVSYEKGMLWIHGEKKEEDIPKQLEKSAFGLGQSP